MRAADFIIVGAVLFSTGFAAVRTQEVMAQLRGGPDKTSDSDFALNWAFIVAGSIFAAIGIIRIVTG